MRWYAAAAVMLAAVLFVACGGDGSDKDTGVATATPAGRGGALAAAVAVEADDDPTLPGEHIELPAIYAAPYPDTAKHVMRDVDYAAEGVGVPPVGGPHWGMSACGSDPAAAPPFCGPAPWGVYRAPWEPETLVHNMEHAGVVIWYHTADQAVIDALEDFAVQQLRADRQLVLAPYPDMQAETVAITVWSRRDMFPAADLDTGRLQDFIDVLYCRFDPEAFC